ncbi:hypothetical protein F5148DRAFT_1226410 [Russula earlei]|uniref:Uncharacterized protein n=1 Tax=Russula earlei TaxID=71964 RepID=A0ACC0U0S6_9AGAM|nr:hypothetical protein F5148DRAFT_1226410 [Russula earlei]
MDINPTSAIHVFYRTFPHTYTLIRNSAEQYDNPISCHLCGSEAEGRNIVLCFDGTSNQFGQYNTNVVELYSRITKSERQVTYYNSGIGTYARPSWRSLDYITQVANNKIDLMIAWNFDAKVLAGYRWLSEQYLPGDKIFLFGFSRGAYQVRALAGMISKVGLIFPGNDEQIAFAYELYADLKHDTQKFDTSVKQSDGIESERNSAGDDKANMDSSERLMAARFKQAFARPNVKVHFVGVWDTVSSVGVIRKKSLPCTDSFDPEHVCYFRHALALDERRVKFLPEYVCGGVSIPNESKFIKLSRRGRDAPDAANDAQQFDSQAQVDDPSIGVAKETDSKGSGSSTSSLSRIKEVWFAGLEAGNQKNAELNNTAVPVLWMGNEAWIAGLGLEPSKVEWEWEKLKYARPQESLLEIFPFKRISYRDKDSTTWLPHLGQGRTIMPGQKIHASVAFIQNYQPKAKFSVDVEGGDWIRILGTGRQDSFDWTDPIRDLMELDLFNPASVKRLVASIIRNRSISDIERLHFWASRTEGRQAILKGVELTELLRIADDKSDTSISKQKLIRETLFMLFKGVPASGIQGWRLNDKIGRLLFWMIRQIIEKGIRIGRRSSYDEEFDEDTLKIISRDNNYGLPAVPTHILNEGLDDFADRRTLLAGVVLLAHIERESITKSLAYTNLLEAIKSSDTTPPEVIFNNGYDAALIGQLYLLGGRVNLNDGVLFAFKYIGKRPFAFDMFSSLLTKSGVDDKLKGELLGQLVAKVDTSKEDSDGFCDYLQALTQLIRTRPRDIAKIPRITIEKIASLADSDDYGVKWCGLQACVALKEEKEGQSPVNNLTKCVLKLRKEWKDAGPSWPADLSTDGVPHTTDLHGNLTPASMDRYRRSAQEVAFIAFSILTVAINTQR